VTESAVLFAALPLPLDVLCPVRNSPMRIRQSTWRKETGLSLHFNFDCWNHAALIPTSADVTRPAND